LECPINRVPRAARQKGSRRVKFNGTRSNGEIYDSAPICCVIFPASRHLDVVKLKIIEIISKTKIKKKFQKFQKIPNIPKISKISKKNTKKIQKFTKFLKVFTKISKISKKILKGDGKV
jgi:hypothetical protein